jgi:hydrogenase nickel incorporation protein HypB
MEANDEIASRLRRSFAARGVFVLNLISAPGSGKTTLLEHTLAQLAPLRVSVLVGDVETERDAERLRSCGVPVSQIVTAGTCHLEAEMVANHLPEVDQRELDLLIVENVGNLVCPTAYDLGEDAKVALVSTTEGEDKPLKYPAIFHRAQVALVTKSDLAPYLDFDREALFANIHTVHPGLDVLEVSAKTGEGLDRWLAWIRAQVEAKRAVPSGV